MTDKEKRELKDGVISIFNRFNILDHAATIGGLRNDILRYIDSLQEEPVSEDLENISNKYCINAESSYTNDMFDRGDIYKAFKAGAEWQKEKVNEALLSEVLPYFMRGGESDELVAKLDEVLNQK